ncbi:MAG: D-amino acid aminotransferase [Piscirickettsiaceae bacterium]|nr:D-amino acid aminotransferase [Piscirickettsiaceae bacterium]
MADVFINGSFIAAEQATVSVFDRGFLLGDGVYEVIPVYAGRCFELAGHLNRLKNSLAGVKMANPYNDQEWESLFDTLIKRNGGGEQALYMQVSRGVAPRDHVFPEGVDPSVFVMTNPLHPVSEKVKTQGIKVVTLNDTRWQRCDIKAISLLPNSLLKQEAKEAGADEALLIRNGFMTEGSASNSYAVFDSVIYTAPKNNQILPGITRDVVLSLAEQAGIAVVEEAVAEARLSVADELWVSSSTKEILPITTLNGQAVGSGKPGPVWHQIDALYQQVKAEA